MRRHDDLTGSARFVPGLGLLAALALTACLAGAPGADAGITLPSIYGSHMVLQSRQAAEFWGMAGAGAAVHVTVGAAPPLTTAADPAGRFAVELPPMPPSLKPVSITVTSGTDSLELVDVLFGSVYVCSGQSNMELPVMATANATAEVAAAGTHGDGLRIMQVDKSDAYYNVSAPQTNLTLSIPWTRPGDNGGAALPGMSALCYYYGVEQVARDPSVPVGMVASSWGGTDVQVWMSPAALAKCGGAQKQSDLAANPDIGLGYLRGASDEVGAARAVPGAPATPPAPPLPHAGCPSVPSTLWNAMIAPLLPLRVTGWLWYQGESNAAAPAAYECQFPAKIAQWRASWPGANASTAYIFVQIAPWPAHDVGLITGIRHAQRAALELAGVGMVVAADIGDPAGAFHPIHPPWKQEVARRAAVIAENLVHGDKAVPLQGPTPVKVTWSSWDPSWGAFHHEISNGVCGLTTGPGKGFLCGGIQVTFDMPIAFRSMLPSGVSNGISGLATGQGGGGGFELWNNNTPSLNDCDRPGRPQCTAIPAMLGPSGEVLTSTLCTNPGAGCPLKQPMEVTGIMADGRTLQLNVTFISGLPKTLKYAWHDYPTMTVYSPTSGRPAPPFNATIVAVPK